MRSVPFILASVTHPGDSFNGWRLTLVDSLDTMLLMGLHDEFREAVPILANMTFALEEVSYVYICCEEFLPHVNPQGILCPILRNRHPIPWGASFRLRAVRRAHSACKGRRPGNDATPCVQYHPWSSYVCREHRLVRMVFRSMHMFPDGLILAAKRGPDGQGRTSCGPKLSAARWSTSILRI